MQTVMGGEASGHAPMQLGQPPRLLKLAHRCRHGNTVLVDFAHAVWIRDFGCKPDASLRPVCCLREVPTLERDMAARTESKRTKVRIADARGQIGDRAQKVFGCGDRLDLRKRKQRSGS